MRLLIKWAVLVFVLALLGSCQSKVEQKPEPKPVVEEKQPDPYEQNQPEQNNKYKSPDRGLGTLDYSRDAKEATDADTQNSEKAMQDTDQ